MTHSTNKKGSKVDSLMWAPRDAAFLKFITYADVQYAYADGQRLGEEVLNQMGTEHADSDQLYFSLLPAIKEANNFLASTKLRGSLSIIQKALKHAKAS